MTERPNSLVLGVSSGLGQATARALADAGHGVFGVHFDIGDAAEAAIALERELATTSGFARLFNGNAAAAATIAETTAAIRQTLPPGESLRSVVHSLSFGALLPFVAAPGEPRIERARMDMTLTVMAHSLVYWCQALADADLIGPGSKVLAFTSAGSSRVSVGYGAVSAAKAALESHVRQLAVELAPRGVSVNAVRAGVTRTPSFDKIPDAARLAARAQAGNPYGRLTEPADIGEAVALLVAARSSWITGNVIGADGGEILTT